MHFALCTHHSKYAIQQICYHRHDDAEQQCPPKAVHLKTVEQFACQQNDDGIDDEQKQPERYYRYGNGQQRQKRFQQHVQQTDDKRHTDGCPITFHADARQQPRRQIYGQCRN